MRRRGHTVEEASVFSPSRLEVRVPARQVNLRRTVLDALLARHARERGTVFCRGEARGFATRPGGGVTVEVVGLDRPLESRAAVVATGCNLRPLDGHGARVDATVLRGRLDALERAAAQLVLSADFLADMRVFHVDEVANRDQGAWLAKGTCLGGVLAEPVQLTSDRPLVPREVYVTDSPTERLDRDPIPLGPFLLWQAPEGQRDPEVFFFNDAWRTKLEYLSYTSGAYYFHKELHAGFEGLITIKPVPGASEDPHRHLAAEERAYRAEALYKRACLSRADGRAEEALLTLEQAAELERRPTFFVEMAEIQLQLGDPTPVARHTLQSCLDLAPEHPRAVELAARLDRAPAAAAARPAGDDAGSGLEQPSILHAFAPRRFRPFPSLWWGAALLLWYGASGAVEALVAGADAVASSVLQLLCCLTMVAILQRGRLLTLRLRLPLSLQLGAMRLDRFDELFAREMERTFGRFVSRDARIRVVETVRGDRLFYAVGAAWTLGLAAAAFCLSGSHLDGPWLAAKRFVDYALIYLFSFPVLRFVVGLTLLVLRVSRLPLKPMLTRLNDTGLRAFGPLLTSSQVLIAGCYACHWLLAARAVRIGVPVDLLFLAIASALAALWCLALPVALQRAAREAKSRSILVYTEHLERAFAAFLEHPADDGRLEEYRTLQRNQDVVRRIATWPLSRTETLVGVVGSTALVAAVDVWYTLQRLGLWPGPGLLD